MRYDGRGAVRLMSIPTHLSMQKGDPLFRYSFCEANARQAVRGQMTTERVFSTRRGLKGLG